MNPVMHWTARFAMRNASRIWFRVRRIGESNVPAEGGVLLVGNHTSHLDPPLVGAFTRRPIWFIGRSTLGKSRLAAWFLRSFATIFIDRDAPSRSSMQAAIDVLQRGEPLLMFPEGTRSRDGSVGRFLRGFELIVRRAGVPVLPVGLRGPFRAMPRGVAFPRPVRIELHYGEPIPAADVLREGGVEAVRRRVAELAAAPLAGSESPQTQSEPPPRADGSELVRRRSDGPTAASNH